MTPDDLSNEDKDLLIKITKKALQLCCIRLTCYEGTEAITTDPEEWIKRAYFLLLEKDK